MVRASIEVARAGHGDAFGKRVEARMLFELLAKGFTTSTKPHRIDNSPQVPFQSQTRTRDKPAQRARFTVLFSFCHPYPRGRST